MGRTARQREADYDLTAPDCPGIDTGCTHKAQYGYAGMCRKHWEEKREYVPRKQPSRTEARREKRAQFDLTAPGCADPTCTNPAYYGMNGWCSGHYRQNRGYDAPGIAKRVAESDPNKPLSADEVAARYARVFEVWSGPNKSVGPNPTSEPWDALERKQKKPIMWDVHYKYTLGAGLAAFEPPEKSGERWEAYQKWLPIYHQVVARRRSNQKLMARKWRTI